MVQKAILVLILISANKVLCNRTDKHEFPAEVELWLSEKLCQFNSWCNNAKWPKPNEICEAYKSSSYDLKRYVGVLAYHIEKQSEEQRKLGIKEQLTLEQFSVILPEMLEIICPKFIELQKQGNNSIKIESNFMILIFFIVISILY